ncbi:hypothetical protein ACWIUD_00870 [Helicobacter sp. 23-1044]
MRENIKIAESIADSTISCDSQNLHYSPSLRDFAKQNRGNLFLDSAFLCEIQCFSAFFVIARERSERGVCAKHRPTLANPRFCERRIRLQIVIMSGVKRVKRSISKIPPPLRRGLGGGYFSH